MVKKLSEGFGLILLYFVAFYFNLLISVFIAVSAIVRVINSFESSFLPFPDKVLSQRAWGFANRTAFKIIFTKWISIGFKK